MTVILDRFSPGRLVIGCDRFEQRVLLSVAVLRFFFILNLTFEILFGSVGKNTSFVVLFKQELTMNLILSRGFIFMHLILS